VKIIFDSEKQKNDLTGKLCPYDVNSDIDEHWCYRLMCRNDVDCGFCWAESGIEMEVRDD
jgi:hypothetical protein